MLTMLSGFFLSTDAQNCCSTQRRVVTVLVIEFIHCVIMLCTSRLYSP